MSRRLHQEELAIRVPPFLQPDLIRAEECRPLAADAFEHGMIGLP
jgi:hypothetical protein